MNAVALLLILSLCPLGALAASGDDDVDSTLRRPKVSAFRTSGILRIDGLLNEADWDHPPITGFTQKDPIEGNAPSQPTEVQLLYDDAALYIGAKLHDSHPDSIVRRIGRRDSDELGDWFYVGIDSYHDRRTGYFFGVYASGSIVDGTLYNDEWDDDSWDGVWEAATHIDSDGWSVEIKIPYSQLRFSDQPEHVWGINFARKIDRLNEEDYFVMVPKKENGWVSRFADLQGIRDISPPSRMEILPYIVTGTDRTTNFDPGDPFNDGSRWTGNFGADFKLGLGSNLTLNATINPDFGQVEVDPAVVNLSQFETFYEEKRPFFVEGSNLFNFGFGGANSNWSFNFGSPDFFYSRRVGRPPQGDIQHDGFSDYPEATSILGAGKLTGKIGENWSLAVLSAVTEREFAAVQDDSGKRFSDVVEPLTSYTVFRTLKEFENGKRGLGVIGTGTVRDLNEPYLPDQFNSSAFAGGLDGWTNLDADREYVITGWLAASRVNGSAERMVSVQRNSLHYYQRPDIDQVSLDSSRTSLSGFGGRIAVNKQKGNFKLNTAIGVVSPGFEVNDIGFLWRTDVINAHLMLGYRWYQPDGLFRNKGFNVATFRNYDFGGNKTDEGYALFFDAQLMNYLGINGNMFFNPATLDRFSTRGGPMMMYTNRYSVDLYVETDERKDLSASFGGGAGRSESGGYRVSVETGVVVKPSAGFRISFSPEFTRDITVAQFVTNQEDPTATSTYGTRHVFGRIDQRELAAGIRIDWTFTPWLSLQVYIQPLISVGSYTDFKELRAPRTYTFNRYGQDDNSTITYDGDEAVYTVDPDGAGPAQSFTFDNPDFNFKSLRGNAVLRWEFLPGSTAYLVWTQSRENHDDPGTFSFGRDFDHMITSGDHENIFLLKIAYWWHP